MNNELYVLEWSKKQGMPHVQPLEATLSKNRKAYMENQSVGDYIPIFVGTFKEVSDAADAIRPTLEKRHPERFETVTL